MMQIVSTEYINLLHSIFLLSRTIHFIVYFRKIKSQMLYLNITIQPAIVQCCANTQLDWKHSLCHIFWIKKKEN